MAVIQMGSPPSHHRGFRLPGEDFLILKVSPVLTSYMLLATIPWLSGYSPEEEN